MKAYFITSDTHIRKLRSISDITNEVFKIRNCSVGVQIYYPFEAYEAMVGVLEIMAKIVCILLSKVMRYNYLGSRKHMCLHLFEGNMGKRTLFLFVSGDKEQKTI